MTLTTKHNFTFPFSTEVYLFATQVSSGAEHTLCSVGKLPAAVADVKVACIQQPFSLLPSPLHDAAVYECVTSSALLPFSEMYELSISRRFEDVLKVLQCARAAVPMASFRQYKVMSVNLSLDPE